MKKTTKLTPNIPLLRKIKKRILQRPRQFIMSDFFSSVLDGGVETEDPSHCGTAACIAGWALVLDKKPIGRTPAKAEQYDYPDNYDDAYRNPFWTDAQQRLRLTSQQTHLLFRTSGWPKKFSGRYYVANADGDYPKAAQIAASRIDHFIKTKR